MHRSEFCHNLTMLLREFDKAREAGETHSFNMWIAEFLKWKELKNEAS
jgi:queuine/archaeosine tRNA-ribosyltransferase